jgi:hypothetical protein
MNRKRYRAPSTGRREGAPSGKSGKREKGKRLPGPDSPRRDKTLFDGGGGAPHGVPEASMRRVIRGIGGDRDAFGLSLGLACLAPEINRKRLVNLCL